MNKEATIHFTDKGLIPITKNNGLHFGQMETQIDYFHAKDLLYYEIIDWIEPTPDLLKKRLEAVIQKEAEEKYPLFKKEEVKNASEHFGDYLRRGQNDRNKKFQREYISWWQSLLSRLPSESAVSLLKEAKIEEESISNTMIDAVDKCVEIALSKLLPSLPETAQCEVKEENGKIEVKKLKI